MQGYYTRSTPERRLEIKVFYDQFTFLLLDLVHRNKDFTIQWNLLLLLVFENKYLS